ncbi:glycosyltransferase family 4 protein [Novosphingobium kaempferiae]|uniref:glycosyltransferase family 4 protein n=1 Tax=Novosphingobium kaempferiae TaxID=2896849 RepID=UPI001E60E957|nr:glycosyltransferase family 4 protein [Novosphingobium kaempferiae]
MTHAAHPALSQLRVLWVSHGFGYGGDLMYFGEIFRSFRNMVPHTSVVVDDRTSFKNAYEIALKPILHVWRKAIKRTAPDGQIYETEIAFPSPRFAARLAGEKADVVIAIEFTPAALIATAMTAVMRRKLVLLVESDPSRRGGSRNKIVRSIKQWAVRRAHVIQTNNVHGQRYLVEDLGAPPERVRVAPYLTSRPPGASGSIEAHSGPLRILYANSINPRKGLRQLLEAIQLLDPSIRADLALTVVGDGPERAELEAFAASTLGLGERLRFVGKRTYADLGAFYAEADVLASPSLADYRSLAGFEGLGYGLALLSSIHDGATEETVEDGVNGFAIDPTETVSLADHIRRLVEDRNLVLAMRQASARIYAERFSLETIADNLAQSVALAARA